MKKIFLMTLAMILSVGFAWSQQAGLENVVVEVFYISDANDADPDLIDEVLAEGSVTYRVYLDMAPDWEFQALYGENNPTASKVDVLKINSTMPFFNNEDRGEIFGYDIGTNRLDDGTVMIDSYFSTGRTSGGTDGVLKDEDTDGAIQNGDGVLQNDDPLAGTPINEKDGNIPSTSTTTFITTGITDELDVFGDEDLAGNSFELTDASIAILGGATGPTADNRILIGQFTTLGDFSFELNVQLRNAASGEVQQWVAQTPQAGQFSIPALIFPLAVNEAPTADFTADPMMGTAPLAVNFDASASSDPDGNIVSYAWDFGDNNTGTGVMAMNTYANAGTYTVTLTVTDDDGATATATKTITVSEPQNQAPTASFTATPTTGVAPLVVDFDASASSDPDGTIASYAWDFGDGIMGTGVTANHTFMTAGTFTVTLTVTDDDGATATITETITVSEPQNMIPTAAFTATPTSGIVPLAVSFDASASSDPDGTIASYAWDFGDGNMGTGVTANHTFMTAGTFTVTLTVTDDDGATATATETITVSEPQNMAPTASFTTTATTGSAPLGVDFDASASSDVDGTIASYAWDFGDGNTGTGVTTNNTFTNPGTYIVTLTVTDDDGAIATATTTITVEELTSNMPPNADFSAAPTAGVAPLVVNFNASTSTDPDGMIVSYDWNFGDGNAGTGVSPTHTFTDPGNYTVTLTVTDDNGATDTETQMVSLDQSGQPGLEDIIVEVFYVADANDATAPEAVVEGAKTYRVYVDMASNWEFQALYGENNPAANKVDELKIESTAPFFNNEDRGATFGYDIETDRLSGGTVMLDSYFTTSRSSDGTAGVEKDEDTDGAIVNADGFLQNNDPLAGTPISEKDGNVPSTATTTFESVGFGSTLDDIFGEVDQAGNSLVTNNASLAVTESLVGSTPDNKVLIGQFTTHGDFSFELNVQLRNTISGEVQQWVARTPQPDQYSMDALIYIPNVAPTAEFTADPMMGTAPLEVNFDASSSSDPDGDIVSYDWDFGNGNMGTGVTPNTTYTTAGTYTVTLSVTDNEGATATVSKMIQVDSGTTTETARVQFIHSAPSETIRIEIDGMDYGTQAYWTATPYIDVPVGTVNIELIPTNPFSTVSPVSFMATFVPDETYVVTLYGTFDESDNIPVEAGVFMGSMETVDASSVGLLFFHGSPDQQEVDVVTGGSVLFDNVEYGTYNDDYTVVLADDYIIDLTPANATNTLRRYSLNIDFWKGKTAVIFATGFEGDGTFQPWVALSNGGTFPLTELPLNINGTNQRFNSLTQKFNNTSIGLEVFPNPAEETFFTSVYLEQESQLILELFNNRGEKVKEIFNGLNAQGNYRFDVDIDNLPSGMYYVRMTTNVEPCVQPMVIIK